MHSSPSPSAPVGPCVALVVAAGRGRRFGAERPKQYAPLAGRPLLHHTLAAFVRHPRIDAVRPVIHPDDLAEFEHAAAGLSVLAPVFGGDDRQESVRLGLESLVELAPTHVLVHDGARPLVSAELIGRVVDALATSGGALPALPVTDSLKRAVDGEVVVGLPREGLWRAQTPQAFHFGPLLAAHRALAGSALTDDSALAEGVGLRVMLVEGEEGNLKVTTPEDLARAERMLARAGGAGLAPRTGQGFDVHRFGPGDGVILCGVRIAHDRALVGHSDADVALHALTDAILGALAEGDIGTHFPPSDPRWRGADSALFLADAAARVRARGGILAHVDLTLICEHPRIGPHRAAMTVRVAEILGLAQDRVGIKATTSEGLGFTGRGEGIAALAVATVLLPG